MTLDDVARYDADRVTERDGHAVVVGASMAGLLAGRVLADAFESVTVLDRDPLPDERVARRGVPQANHVHALLEPGRVMLEDLFPGYGDDLLAEGGVIMDASKKLDLYQQGDFLAESPHELPFYCASRPLFELLVRRRMRERDDVTLRGECHVTGYRSDGEASTVTGVTLVDAADEKDALAADLVVDATGRTSRTPTWLERNGYPTPETEDVGVDLAYSTVAVERPADDDRGYLVVPSPPTTRGGTAVPVEDERWIVTVFGRHGDHPPTDPEGFREFAASLPTAEIRELLDEHEWDGEEIHQYPFPASKRRYYEDLDRFPDGLLVTGDAVASFNPIYGQGMSVAALDALQLHHALANGRSDLQSRFFDRVADTVNVVWRMTVGADFEYAETEGEKPPGTDLLNRYLSWVVDAAHTDGHVSEAFTRVLRLETTPISLMRPSVVGRVAGAKVREYV
ncbi:FAD-dependent oxidoreductase [Halobellus rubicundus]|uniref:FAD-dependent oxidoreductase n=1 Tax=Halobellus rubicundus TaxID=2996466 RepID=A0ABD5ME43_9EURY